MPPRRRRGPTPAEAPDPVAPPAAAPAAARAKCGGCWRCLKLAAILGVSSYLLVYASSVDCETALDRYLRTIRSNPPLADGWDDWDALLRRGRVCEWGRGGSGRDFVDLVVQHASGRARASAMRSTALTLARCARLALGDEAYAARRAPLVLDLIGARRPSLFGDGGGGAPGGADASWEARWLLERFWAPALRRALPLVERVTIRAVAIGARGGDEGGVISRGWAHECEQGWLTFEEFRAPSYAAFARARARPHARLAEGLRDEDAGSVLRDVAAAVADGGGEGGAGGGAPLLFVASAHKAEHRLVGDAAVREAVPAGGGGGALWRVARDGGGRNPFGARGPQQVDLLDRPEALEHLVGMTREDAARWRERVMHGEGVDRVAIIARNSYLLVVRPPKG